MIILPEVHGGSGSGCHLPLLADFRMSARVSMAVLPGIFGNAQRELAKVWGNLKLNSGTEGRREGGREGGREREILIENYMSIFPAFVVHVPCAIFQLVCLTT